MEGVEFHKYAKRKSGVARRESEKGEGTPKN